MPCSPTEADESAHSVSTHLLVFVGDSEEPLEVVPVQIHVLKEPLGQHVRLDVVAHHLQEGESGSGQSTGPALMRWALLSSADTAQEAMASPFSKATRVT